MINDHVLPMHWRAEMARLGLHDLIPYENHDGKWTDPLEDPETLKAIRSFLPKLFRAKQSDMCARCGTLLDEYASLNGKWYCHHDRDEGRPTCYEYAEREIDNKVAEANALVEITRVEHKAMMNRVDELHYGLRCAICEELFSAGDDVRFDNDLNRFHTECLENNE